MTKKEIEDSSGIDEAMVAMFLKNKKFLNLEKGYKP